MAGFVYFVSDRRPVDRQRVVELGCGYILDGHASVASREVIANSPSGQAGRVFGDPARLGDKSLGVYPEQTWRRAPGTDVWVGYWTDATPAPDGLARGKQLAGPTVELGDGNRWQVPLVVALDAAAERYDPALPAAWDLDESGNWVRGPIQDEYKRLWDLATPFADARFELDDRKEADLTNASLLNAVTALLGANYVVDKIELALMGALVDDEATALVPLLACDFFTLAGWLEQKKSATQEAPGDATPDGEAA